MDLFITTKELKRRGWPEAEIDQLRADILTLDPHARKSIPVRSFELERIESLEQIPGFVTKHTSRKEPKRKVPRRSSKSLVPQTC